MEWWDGLATEKIQTRAVMVKHSNCVVGENPTYIYTITKTTVMNGFVQYLKYQLGTLRLSRLALFGSKALMMMPSAHNGI